MNIITVMSDTNRNIEKEIAQSLIPKLNDKAYDIYSNIDGSHVSINGFRPDIVLATKGTNTVKFIMEIVSEYKQDAIPQWKSYISAISATLYLVVPEETLNRFKNLCNMNDLSVRFVSFRKIIGDYNFDFE